MPLRTMESWQDATGKTRERRGRAWRRPVTASALGRCGPGALLLVRGSLGGIYSDWPGARSDGLPVVSRHVDAPLVSLASRSPDATSLPKYEKPGDPPSTQ